MAKAVRTEIFVLNQLDEMLKNLNDRNPNPDYHEARAVLRECAEQILLASNPIHAPSTGVK